MLSTYYSFPMQAPENELVDERWDSDFESSRYSVTDHKHINDKKNYITPTTLKEINLTHSNNIVKASITPNKDIDDDAYFEITIAPPDYPSTPSITEDEEEEDDLSTPSPNEALPLEQHNNYYESLEEEEPDQYFLSESVRDYHSELSKYYRQLVLNQFDQLSLSRLESIQDTLPETYKQQIECLSNL